MNCPDFDFPPTTLGCPAKCADGTYKRPGVDCATDANQPKCPDGTSVQAAGCPALCPDGNKPGNAGCTPAFKKCPDGSDGSKPCAAACPDGTQPSNTGCNPITPKCNDGSVPAADGCPQLCPDRTFPDPTNGCVAVVL